MQSDDIESKYQIERSLYNLNSITFPQQHVEDLDMLVKVVHRSSRNTLHEIFQCHSLFSGHSPALSFEGTHAEP